MSWQVIAVDAVLGAFGGIIGWLAGRRLPAKESTNVIRVLPAVVFAVVGHQVVGPVVQERQAKAEIRQVGVTLFGNERAGDLFAERMAPVFRDPRLPQRIQKMKAAANAQLAVSATNPSTTGAMQLVAAGMLRLSDAETSAMLPVKRALAKHSAALCAGFWKGTLSQSELSAGLSALDEAQQRVWIETTSRAIRLELDETPPPTSIPSAKLSAAIDRLSAALSPESRRSLDRALSEGAQVSDDDACRAVRLLADGAEGLADEDRRTLVRFVVAPDSIGP